MVLKTGKEALVIPFDPLDIPLATIQSDLFDIYTKLFVSDERNSECDLCTMTDHRILYLMGNASKKLRKHDDSVMFFKERVKSCVKAYSKGEINQVRYSTTLRDIYITLPPLENILS